MPRIFSILCLIFLAALAGITLGVRMAALPRLSKRVAPFSGGVLFGIAACWIFPEIASEAGWTTALLGAVAGFAGLWSIDRFIYPVCPACAHGHDHSGCARPLHGFTAPLLFAAGVHSFFDGWGLTISQQQPSATLKFLFLAGIALHKFPEGLALSALLLAATGSAWRAGLSALAVQSAMFAGALAALLLSSRLTPGGASVLLAMAAGVFVYLGYHAIEGSLRQRGWASAMPALAGAGGAAALRLLPGL